MKIFSMFLILSSIQCHSFTLMSAIENLQSQKLDFSNVRKDLEKLFKTECDEIANSNPVGTK